MIKKILKTVFMDYPIYIFGCGRRGKRFASILKQLDANIVCFFDSDESKVGTEYLGIPIYRFEKSQIVNGVIFVSPADDKCILDTLLKCGNEAFPIGDLNKLETISSFISYNKAGFDYLYPLTHFYSPYSDINWCKEHEQTHNNDILDIDFNINYQIKLLAEFKKLYSDLPSFNNSEKYRYFFPNNTFGIDDALVYHCFIRTFKPRKIIEIGSGLSSAIALDTNEFYLNNSIELKFIEPYPTRLKKILKKNDEISLEERLLQDVDTTIFKKLERNDILFIDSSHVSKRDSDVNEIFFEILPQLTPGVIIHFHDIFPRFEYPIEWTQCGFSWTEDYLLRAFLMNNNSYEIIFFNQLMTEKIEENSPYTPCCPGTSLWLRKKE